MNPDFSFHHLAILTTCLTGTRDLYVSKFNYIDEHSATTIADLGIKACSLSRDNAPRLELIEALDEESPMGIRARKGTGGYHLAWLVPSLDTAVETLEASGFHGLQVFQSPLWEGARCRFMVGPGNELIEFIEQS